MCRSNLAAVASLFSGPIVVSGSDRVAEPDALPGGRHHPLDELRPDRRVHQEPLACRAALPGAQVGGLQRRLGGQPEVGVRQHHHRAVAAEFKQLRLAGRAGRDQAAGRRPSRRTRRRATPGCPARASPTTGPGPGTKLNTPGGSPAPASTSASSAQHADVVGAGHPDHGVPRRHGRGEQLGAHRVRPVPRADHADHAERHPGSEDPPARLTWRRAARLPGAWRPRRPSGSTRPARPPRRRPRRPAACPGPG